METPRQQKLNKKRKRSKKPESDDNIKNENIIVLTQEGFRNKKFSNYFPQSLSNKEIRFKNLKKDFLFENKEMKNILNNYSELTTEEIEYLLELDNTNQDIQKFYLKLIVQTISNEDLEKEIIDFLTEEIEKSIIILNENDYNNIISNIKNPILKIKYKDYKKNFIETLNYI